MFCQMSRVLGCVLLAGLVGGAQGREWRDSTGKYAKEAEFVALRDGVVHLRQSDGKKFAIPESRLSQRDQAYVATFAEPSVAEQETPFLPTSEEEKNIGGGPQVDFAVYRQDTEPAVIIDERRIRKFVYYSCHSTTHLIDFGPTQGTGTIHYAFAAPGSSHCCTSLKWHLALLQKYNQTSDFFFYHQLNGHPNIVAWAFATKPDYHGCRYSIWYKRQDGSWHRFEYADRVHPQ